MTRIIGIDPGNVVSGIAMLNNGQITFADTVLNKDVFKCVKGQSISKEVCIVIEDMQPYLMRISQQVIDTAKFIGELTFRFNTCDFVKELKLIPRNVVKKWIFDSCPDICLPRINAKMLTVDKRMVKNGKKGLRKSDGEMRLPSFHYVDDRVVIAALKHLYNIPTPKPGKPNIYGLKEHSWQSLAVAAYISSSLECGALTTQHLAGTV